ncbi:MAG: hypothetical protein RIC87_13485 [Kiloniellales bacterium]
MRTLLLLASLAGLTGCTDKELRETGIFVGEMAGFVGCMVSNSCNDFCGADASVRDHDCRQPRY